MCRALLFVLLTNQALINVIAFNNGVQYFDPLAWFKRYRWVPQLPERRVASLPNTSTPRIQQKTDPESLILEFDQSYGFTEVRPGAMMFHWLFYAGGQIKDAEKKPLVLWLQGGPGASATAYGNFDQLGPLDMNLKPRNSTWVRFSNVIFIDNPVGVGFSYVKNGTSYCRNTREIALDLIEWTKSFMSKYPMFRSTPFHVFSESYAGKIAVEYGYLLDKEIKAGNIAMNLKTIGIGSGFIDPLQCALTYPSYLYNLGMIDQPDAVKAYAIAQEVENAIKVGNYTAAYFAWYREELFLIHTGGGLNVMNVMTQYSPRLELGPFVDKVVRKALKIPDYVKFDLTSAPVYLALRDNFMRSSNHFVEKLLNETQLSVVVYNGNFDMVVDIAGTMDWVNALRWPGAQAYRQAARLPLPGVANGFVKRYGTFSMWWINKSGHTIAVDNPEAMYMLLEDVLGLKSASIQNN